MASSPPAVADQAQARSLFKAMTDYVGAQQSISFDYDATLEVVTKDRQKLQLASSGTVSLARPDKIRTTRSGGFVDMETVFDGKTLTLFGKNKNVYTQVELPGSLDNLMNELHKKYDRPLPAADLFFTRAPRRDYGRRDGRQGPFHQFGIDAGEDHRSRLCSSSHPLGLKTRSSSFARDSHNQLRRWVPTWIKTRMAGQPRDFGDHVAIAS